MSKRLLFLRLLVLSLISSSFAFFFLPALHQAHASTSRSLVLVGGNLQDNDAAVYNKIISLAGGTSSARIGIITAASIPRSQDPNAGTSSASNSYDNAQYYINLFKNTYHAYDAQWIPIDLDSISNNSSQTVVNQINSMTGFFFGGGDQSRLITCFYSSGRTDSPALAAIRAKYNNGAVISGSSAGTEVQSTPMVTGGESYDGLAYGSHTYVSTTYPDDLSYDPQGGFNFFQYGLVDAHYSQRGRQGRMIRLLSDTSTTMGYGVDEDTALVVVNADTSSAQLQVLGTGGVTIVDLSHATVGSGSDFTLTGARLSYLTPGDTYNFSTKTASIASWKSSLAGHEQYSTPMSPTDDIFSSPNNTASGGGRANPLEFVIVANDLFNSRSSSTYGLTYESGPTFKVTLTKSSSSGYKGTQSGTTYASYVNLKVDISIY
ncbi:cyanophycinase [Tengunoibacter tsumagoiensis]|uniref:Cyanophycinase n=1 Tax=Tengunoibacter tsumagoiensis TaxID=2014871 RepID=A0A402A718_9CHLR|nr:cyanophycinase [Tengunoibacter tsumagoiensis]GCE14826.1 hypothetical protein KTT_46850 [Tengunoibacter tsumagoiensis]